MSKEHFETKKAVIEAIPDELAVYPVMPVDIALQEAEDLHVWCQADSQKLLQVGLDPQFITDIPIRAGALRYIQSQWQKEYRSFEDSQKEWNQKSPAAYQLRDELLHHFFFAYTNFSDVYARVQKIAEGDTHADMIQDLSDLSALGKANLEPLRKINLDMGLLDAAETMSEQMAKLLAAANGKKLDDNKLRLTRDKAFTYLKQAVDEVRRCGQYVFYRDEQRYKGYVSRYFQKKSAKAATKSKEKTEKTV